MQDFVFAFALYFFLIKEFKGQILPLFLISKISFIKQNRLPVYGTSLPNLFVDQTIFRHTTFNL